VVKVAFNTLKIFTKHDPKCREAACCFDEQRTGRERRVGAPWERGKRSGDESEGVRIRWAYRWA
jgi:hypothetical protein